MRDALLAVGLLAAQVGVPAGAGAAGQCVYGQPCQTTSSTTPATTTTIPKATTTRTVATTTTVAVTRPTVATTRPPTPTTEPQVVTTTTTALSDTTTVPGTPVTTVPARRPPELTLDRASSEPGGQVVLTGSGCDANAVALVSVAGNAVGSVPADANGGLIATLTLPDLPVGRFDVSVACGPDLVSPIDVVVASQVDSGISTLAVFIFFVLLSLVLFRRRRLHPQQAYHPKDDALGGDAD